ncbi:hypothetical protein [Caballeronia insecticola]|uniref:Transmembrane protein n=1 Tax=Caballeronia insecticola TaxID=758793 RepID=R4WVD3_9BURK|nr:hypothetical protein [Caballeronia insecticola]BAN22886.1 putative uncharacterized protein [Caballeronia insecticola]
MYSFWLPLAFSLSLLGLTLFICRTINAAHRTLRWNGALFFFVLCTIAMVLDFMLTMVFASAGLDERTPYDSFASRAAWSERILTYLIPCALSVFLAWRFRRRQRQALDRKRSPRSRNDSVQIQTSPYSQSKLPL